MKSQEESRDDGKDEQAGFGPHRASRKPLRPLDQRLTKMIGKRQPFVPRVGKTEKKERPEIEGEMPADGKPKVAEPPARNLSPWPE